MDDALCGRLETAITQSLIRDCTQGVIARNVSTSTKLDFHAKFDMKNVSNNTILLKIFAANTLSGAFRREIPANERFVLTRGRSSRGMPEPLRPCVPHGPRCHGPSTLPWTLVRDSHYAIDRNSFRRSTYYISRSSPTRRTRRQSIQLSACPPAVAGRWIACS